MREMMRFGLTLAIICVLAAGLLATANKLTGPKILAAAQSEEQSALKEVMPQAAKFTAVKSDANQEILYYQALDNQGKLMGFVFKASGKGYSSSVETLAGIFLDEKISAIKVISLNETPGLGMRVTESKFTDQFKQQNSLDVSGVQAITGATISSRAVMDSVMKKAREIKALIENDSFDSAQGHAEQVEGKPQHDQ